jgi:hypothetical protein
VARRTASRARSVIGTGSGSVDPIGVIAAMAMALTRMP